MFDPFIEVSWDANKENMFKAALHFFLMRVAILLPDAALTILIFLEALNCVFLQSNFTERAWWK